MQKLEKSLSLNIFSKNDRSLFKNDRSLVIQTTKAPKIGSHLCPRRNENAPSGMPGDRAIRKGGNRVALKSPPHGFGPRAA